MHRHIITALALAGTALSCPILLPSASTEGYVDLRFNRHLPLGAQPRGHVSRRSRGLQAHPKRRRNLVTHSRRVRRKHRRAA